MSIDIIKKALDNWGRWARSDIPRLDCPSIAGGFGQMIHEDTDDYHTLPVDAPYEPIRVKEAEALDITIMTLSSEHVIVIKRWWYNRLKCTDEEYEALDRKGWWPTKLQTSAAQRALADKLEPKWAGYAVTLKRVA